MEQELGVSSCLSCGSLLAERLQCELALLDTGESMEVHLNVTCKNLCSRSKLHTYAEFLKQK